MTKIFVVADIHFPDRISEIPKVEQFIETADVIFALGDFTSFCVLEYLKKLRKVLYAVSGNMDDKIIKATLPNSIEAVIDGIKIGITHGSGPASGIEKRIKQVFEKELDAYVFGHSHIATNKIIEGSFFFNPGSISSSTPSVGFIYIHQKNIWGEIVSTSKTLS